MGRRRKGARVRGPYQKPSGKWIIQIVTGCGIQTESFATKGSATARLKSLRSALGIGQSIGEAIVRYLDTLTTESGIQECTRYQYGVALRHYLDIEAPLSTVRAEPISEVFDDRKVEQSPVTLRAELRTVRAFSAWVAENFPAEMSAAELLAITKIGRRIKGRGKRKEQLTEDEGERFVETAYQLAEGADLWQRKGSAVALIAILLGVRSGEIVALKGRDIDRKGRVLIVRGTKSESSDRRLEIMDSRLTSLLLSLKREPEAWLFPGRYDSQRHINVTFVRDSVARICEAAEVKLVCPHGLRGTFTSHAIAAGVDPRLVSRAIGHAPNASGLAVTLGSYAKPGSVATGRARIAQLRVIAGGAR